jgi:hypothetical protein
MSIGPAYNVSLISFTERKDFADKASLSLLGNTFRFGNIIEGIAMNGILYYSFTSHPTKYTYMHSRSFTATQGPVLIESFEGSSFTLGSPLTATNTFRGKGDSHGAIITYEPTAITGGIALQPELIPSAGVNTGVGDEAGTPLILPPASTLITKITNQDGNGNAVRFGIIFSEVNLPHKYRV